MDLAPLFYPESIAIIGASRKKKSVGNDVVKNLVEQGYQGKIIPINPKASELYGLQVYSDIAEVETEIDLVIAAIPAPIVAKNLKTAAEKGAKAAAVISAGFKEIGNVELEQELKQVCQENDMILVGPNCLGVINPEIKMNASFAHILPPQGSVAFMSQSGALCTAVLDYAESLNLGFSKFLSLGNKAAMDELQLIKYFAQDEQTEVILIYSEEMTNAPEFIKTVKQINSSQHPKPIIVLKSGRTEEGAQAIASHTGSLAGQDVLYQAMFEQAGVIRADTIQELFDLAQIFARNKLQSIKNTAIITNAGGPGVLTTDAVVANGLELAELSADTETKIEKFLPAAANCKNPIDVLGDAQADRYRFVLEALVQDDQVDSIVLLLTPQSMTEIKKTAQAVIDVKQNYDKPITVSFIGGKTVKPGMDAMNQAGVTAASFPESCANGLAKFSNYIDFIQRKTTPVLEYDDVDRTRVEQIFAKAKNKGQSTFPEAEALEIIKAYNFPILHNQTAYNKSQALDIAQQLGGELAMKIVSPDILHKSDVGGVILNATADNVAAKYEKMMQTVSANKPEAKLKGVLLMEMAPADGLEVILGVNKTPGLGTAVMVGLGGIYVEVLKDVNFAFAPITAREAEELINNLQTAELLDGIRGEAAKDKAKLIECIGRLSQLITDFPEIKELDINPLLLLPAGRGAKVLDVRLVIEESA